MPCFFLFLLGLFVWLNFTRYGAEEMYIYYPVVLISLTAFVLFLPAPILFHRSRTWFLVSMVSHSGNCQAIAINSRKLFPTLEEVLTTRMTPKLRTSAVNYSWYKSCDLEQPFAIASLTKLLGTTVTISILPRRISRFFPWRHVLLANIQHGKLRPLHLSLPHGLG